MLQHLKIRSNNIEKLINLIENFKCLTYFIIMEDI